jgi:NAD(P) transhydrogenase
MKYDYNLIILGSGPAGFACAMQASKFGKKVLVVEAHTKYLGGTWINTGTVPSKALRAKANTIYDFTSQFGHLDGVADKPYERFRMRDLLKFKNQTLESENRTVKEALIKNEVDTTRGRGKIVDEHTIEVDTLVGPNQTFSSENILVSTGSHPSKPEKFEVDHEHVLDSQSVLDITHIPRRLIVVGDDVNALEYATMFAALGTKVRILLSGEVLLPFLDEQIQEELMRILKKRRISIHPGAQIHEIQYNPLRTCTEVRFTETHPEDNPRNSQTHVLETEHVLYFGGRTPNSSNIGLDEVSIGTSDEGFIPVNKHYQTETPSIYAAGDVVGFPMLSSTALSQGRLAACDMFGIPALDVPDESPVGIYSIPEIAYIGMTELEAEQKDLDITVGAAYFKDLTNAQIRDTDEGLIKLIFDSKTFELYGVHIIGEQATELIHTGQAVMSLGGDVRYFIQHVLNYPTYTDAYRTAAFNGVNRVFKAGVKYQDILEENS